MLIQIRWSVDKIGLNGPMNKRVRVLMCLLGPTIETDKLAFKVKVMLSLKSTWPGGLWMKYS